MNGILETIVVTSAAVVVLTVVSVLEVDKKKEAPSPQPTPVIEAQVPARPQTVEPSSSTLESIPGSADAGDTSKKIERIEVTLENIQKRIDSIEQKIEPEGKKK